MSYAQVQAYLDGGDCAVKESQVIREIDYFKSFYSPLYKAAFISYDRQAYFSELDSSLRVTFDENILYRNSCVNFTSGVWGDKLIQSGRSLLEIKTAGALPLWLVRALYENGVERCSFSKYGSAYTDMTKGRVYKINA